MVSTLSDSCDYLKIGIRIGDNSAALIFSTYGCKELGPGDLEVTISNFKCRYKDGNKDRSLSEVFQM